MCIRDSPYIAYALHDSEHPDHVTSDNHTRNVWRTPANNKLRMEDKRGEEPVSYTHLDVYKRQV